MQPPGSGPSDEKPRMSLSSYGMLVAFGVIVWFVLGTAMLGILVSEGPAISDELAISPRDFLMVSAVAQIFFILVPTIYLARRHRLGFTEVLRLRPPAPPVWGYALGMLVTGGIVIMTLMVLQEIYIAPLLPDLYSAGSANSEMIEKILQVGSDPFLLILGLFAIALVPAVTEELFFRGLLQRSFEEDVSPLGAISIVAFIFSVVHGQATNMIGLVALGYLLGYVTWVSRSILPAIAMHLLWNAGQFLLLNLTPESAASSEESSLRETLQTLLPISLVALGLLIALIRRFARLRHDSGNNATESG